MYTTYVHCTCTKCSRPALFLYYVTIMHILVLQSDSGFSGSDIPPPMELVSNDGEPKRPVYIHVEPTKELGEYHGNSLLLQKSSQGLISGHLSVGSECFSR